MTDARDIVERLREHATDWNGEQMPDLEPAKSDPTSGTLREAADTIASLRKQLEDAREALRPFAEKSEQAMQGYSANWAERMGPDYPVFGWNGPVFTLGDFLKAREALKGKS